MCMVMKFYFKSYQIFEISKNKIYSFKEELLIFQIFIKYGFYYFEQDSDLKKIS